MSEGAIYIKAASQNFAVGANKIMKYFRQVAGLGG
jgi:hypothetical protein